MKWTLSELIKQSNIDNQIDETVDLSSFIKGTDILAISPVHVTGDFEIYDQEEFNFLLRIQCVLTLQCALTLKEIEYPLDFEVEEVFTTFKDDETRKINGITIDLLPIIWSNIYLEKPMRVVSEHAYEEVDFDLDESSSEQSAVNEVFASLKNNKN
jgi:uncharacterized protein